MAKTFQKSSPPESEGRFPQNLHWGLLPIIVCSNDDPGVTLTHFTASSNLVTLAFLCEKVKKVYFSETIADCDLKLIDLMNICEYLRSRSFLDLG